MNKPFVRSGLLFLALLPCGLFSTNPAVAQAEEDPWARNRWEAKSGRFLMGVGFIYARFDTNAKFTDNQSGLSVYLDAEGTLGLPERDAVPAFYGGFSFSKRHSIMMSYFQIRREVTLLDANYESEGLSIKGVAELQDRTRFYNLAYGNTLFSDERSKVRLLVGLNGLDLRYAFYAEGEIYIEGQLDEDGILDEEVSVLAPLPLVGFDFWFAFTPKWSLNAELKFVGGKYQDITAAVLSTTFVTRYQFNRRLGMLFGINHFRADVKIEDEEERTDVAYGYDGTFVGLHVVF